MHWTVHGETPIYESEWVRLVLADVEIPGHGRIDHHVVRVPSDAAGAVVHDAARGILLIWRHRFITDTWGWEIPAGRVDDGERPIEAAARETLEETGWRPGPLRPVIDYHPSNGLSDQTFHLFTASSSTHVGEPSDPSEAERVEWRSVADVRALVGDGAVIDGLSLTALALFLATAVKAS